MASFSLKLVFSSHVDLKGLSVFVKMSQLQGEKKEIIKMIKGQLVYVDVTFTSKCLVWDERCKN